MSPRRVVDVSALLCVVLLACARDNNQARRDDTSLAPNGSRKPRVVYVNGVPTPAESATRAQASEQPPGAMRPAVSAQSRAKAPIAWDAPASWKSAVPSSSMRVAQYAVPKAVGDSEDAELVVFYFGPSGAGGIEDNLNRWIGMFDGSASPKVERATQQLGKMPLHVVDVVGTYQASAAMAMPGAPASGQAKPGTRMIGAVLETESGPYYFKLLGPDKTVAEARPALMTMLRTVRNDGDSAANK